MSTLGELKWFLGIHVLRDRSRRLLWLTQEAYIEKIAKQYEIDLNGRLPDTPMAESELLPTTYPRSIRPTLKSSHEGLSVRPSPLPKVAGYSTMLYQRKMGSMLYAATTTRPDIAFAVSRLARFNHDPSQEHHRAADRVIQYLYGTRSRAICYGGVNNGTNDMRDDGGGRSGDEARSFICASDASFADNTADRKSSQGYIMTLFGGPIVWRANKQDAVTTSSTEAELLALSQTAKEAIFISRLFKAMTLKLNEPLIIDCDNTQTLSKNQKRHGKANHQAPARRHPPALATPRICHETCDFSMENDEGDACRWTHEGPAEAEVSKLRRHDRNGGYPGTA